MRRADRLFEIIQFMRQRQLTRARDLAEKLEVSERTIYRDIADLMASGVPIEGEAGIGYVLRAGYDLPPLMFKEAEIEALVLGARIVQSWADKELAEAAMNLMTTEEAFVKVLQMHGIEHAFGIIGSAMMPISDLFPRPASPSGTARMRLAGHDGRRLHPRLRQDVMMIAQNGPGITNFVTAVKTAYWNHTPLLLVTPQAANKTIGQGGFQEVEQMKLFEDMVAYQEEVRDPSRIAEVLNRVILKAKRGSAPAQINMPRDFWTQVIDIELPAIVEFERPPAAKRPSPRPRAAVEAKFPVILNGAGVVLGGRHPRLDGSWPSGSMRRSAGLPAQ
jgi:biotin operon repressor